MIIHSPFTIFAPKYRKVKDAPLATFNRLIMYLFYVPDIDKRQELNEEESQHCVRVLRLSAGDNILLTDGRGSTYEARIVNPHPKHCSFEIVSRQEQVNKRPYRLHIGIAPTKNIERLEWMIEKCVEIGIDEITPLLCRFSERKIIKPERLEKIMVSAAKQSLKAYMPVLHDMCSFEEFVKTHNKGQRYIAHCYEQDKRLLQKEIKPQEDLVVLIGPEGDFSEQEVASALAVGYVPVSLGSSRLRTETAGVVACHTAALINEV